VENLVGKSVNSHIEQLITILKALSGRITKNQLNQAL